MPPLFRQTILEQVVRVLQDNGSSDGGIRIFESDEYIGFNLLET